MSLIAVTLTALMPLSHALPKQFIARIQKINCADLITNNRTRSFEYEKAVLDKLDLTKDSDHVASQIKSVKQLSQETFLVTLDDGSQIVVRFPGEHGDPTFEAFANNVFVSQPDLTTPLIKPLEKDAAGTLKAGMSKSSPALKTKIEKIMLGKMNKQEATLAVFYDAQSGYDYLNLNYGFDLRREFNVMVIKSNGKMARDLPGLKAKFLENWATETQLARDNFIKDFKAYFPEAKAINGENDVLKFMMENLDKFKPGQAEAFVDGIWAQMPQTVREQLAEQWVMRTALGSTDFHYDNWLIHNDQVIGIDMAESAGFYRTLKNSETATVEELFENHVFPISDEPTITPSQIRKLLKSVKPEFFKDLETTLSPANLKKAADAAGQPLSAKQIQEIRKRAQLLKKRHDELVAP